ncbi:MAG: ATP-binding cassette domain-containing protein, partial [Actinomycetota bacterium]
TLRLNGAGTTTRPRILPGVHPSYTGSLYQGNGAVVGYYAQEHETLDPSATVHETLASAAPDLDETSRRTVLGSFLFQGSAVDKPTHVLSGGEKTRLALACLVVSGANVLLLDEPTNNLDPASRTEVLTALASYRGAVVLVSHDPGAVAALSPERVVLLPDGDEDLWSDEYAGLVELA